jgi:hypothetical protein
MEPTIRVPGVDLSLTIEAGMMTGCAGGDPR